LLLEGKISIVNKKIIVGALASVATLWALPSHAEQAQMSFTGTVLPACSFVQFDNVAAGSDGRFTLIGNNGSITSVCNTASTLSITVDKVASPIELQNAKIRFTGGTGIYANASSSYQDTASFSSQQTTTAAGDTAQLEVDTVAPRAYSIVVYASLTPQ
jgi:hypothetical protein